MMGHDLDDGLFAGIDGAVILQQIDQKIRGAEMLVADTALDLAGLEANPDAEEAERVMLRRMYRARRFQLEFLRSRKAAIEAAAAGNKSPTPIR